MVTASCSTPHDHNHLTQVVQSITPHASLDNHESKLHLGCVTMCNKKTLKLLIPYEDVKWKEKNIEKMLWDAFLRKLSLRISYHH